MHYFKKYISDLRTSIQTINVQNFKLLRKKEPNFLIYDILVAARLL